MVRRGDERGHGETVLRFNPVSFYRELRRRRVSRVAVLYAVFAWGVIAACDVIFPQLVGWVADPDRAMRTVFIAAIALSPFVLVFGWLYDVTANGIQRTPEFSKTTHDPDTSLHPADRGIIGALSALTLAVLVAAMVHIVRMVPPVSLTEPPERTLPPENSIAVLPLDDLSPTDEAGYLGDGLSEELSSDLARIPGLRVAARRSAFAVGGKGLDVRTIGQELGVRYVLEGSVRREGERVRVMAQLIDAVSGFHVWTESYDRPWQDLIGIQQEISGTIAEQLRIVLTPEDAAQLKRAPTANPRAYDFYLAGRADLRRGGGMSNFDSAEGLFRRALEEDPGFARAHAGLCEVYVTRYSRTQDPADAKGAETACRDALQADANLQETEQALGSLYNMSGRLEQAEALYRSLLTRTPRNADVHIGLGRALEGQNRLEEAEAAYREAVIVEPGYWATYNDLGVFLFVHGRADEAVEAYRRVTEFAPANRTGYNNLGAALMISGKLEEAAMAFERSVEIEPSNKAYSNLGSLYYYLGRMDEAVLMYSKAIEITPNVYYAWGNRANALWDIPSRRAEAIENFRRAAALAEQALAVNDTDAITWAQLGLFYSRLGENDRARRYTQRAIELGPELPEVYYSAASTAVQQGRREEASRHIKRAIELGYPRHLAVLDPDLQGLID